MDRLSSSFEEFSVAWLLVSGIIGGIIGGGIRFAFEDVARPTLAARREVRAIRQRYTPGLLRTGESLERRINIIVRNAEKEWFDTDLTFRLSTLYQFAEYFAWVRAVEFEVGFLPFESTRKGRRFAGRMEGPFRALTSFAYFRTHPDPEEVDRSQIPRLMLRAVGEAVLVEDQGRRRPCDFSEFVTRWSSPAFRRWFEPLETFLTAQRPEAGLRWDRLVIAAAELVMLTRALDPKQRVVRHREPANLSLINHRDAVNQVAKDWKRLFGSDLAQAVPGSPPDATSSGAGRR